MELYTEVLLYLKKKKDYTYCHWCCCGRVDYFIHKSRAVVIEAGLLIWVQITLNQKIEANVPEPD